MKGRKLIRPDVPKVIVVLSLYSFEFRNRFLKNKMKIAWIKILMINQKCKTASKNNLTTSTKMKVHCSQFKTLRNH